MLGKTEVRRRRGWQRMRWLDEHESEQTPGDVEGQGGLVCRGPWGCKESNTTRHLNKPTVAVQYGVGFHHTTMWISHKDTHMPSLLNLPPPHPTPLGCHRAPGWAPWAHTAGSHRPATPLMAVYTRQCYPLDSPHPLPSPLCPQVCPVHLCLYFFPANRFLRTIFLDSIYISRVNMWNLFSSVWLTSLSIACSRFIYCTRMDSNAFLLMAEWYSMGHFSMYHFFIHSSADGQLGCFHILAVVNRAAGSWILSHSLLE